MCKHSVINTGGHIYNDYIDMDDDSGRVIIVSEGGIYVFANDRDYQLQLNPMFWVSSPDKIDEYLPECEPDSWIADLESTTDYVFVRDTSGASLCLYRQD